MEDKLEQKMGIYLFKIGNRKYVGKDHQIQKIKRIKAHLASLKSKTHWNVDMQTDYDLGLPITYEVLWETNELITDYELCQFEKDFIESEGSYKNGYNKTKGGIGLSGIVFTEEQLENKSDRFIGDKNPQSKLSLEDFLDVVDMLNEGYSNVSIAEKYGLHKRYVSLIRNKRRYIKWFELYAPNYNVVSADKHRASGRKLSDEQVLAIYNKYHHKNSCKKTLAEEYKVHVSTISLLVNKKTFKEVTKHL